MKNDLINRMQMKWGKISRRKLEQTQGDLDALVSVIQAAYGYTKKYAEREYHDFQLTLRPVLQPAIVPPSRRQQ